MEEKECATSKKITQELIGGWLLWGMLFGIIYSVLFNVLSNVIDNVIFKQIVVILLQGIITYIIWKFSTKSTFKNRTMDYNDVPKVMKNLLIFTIILCFINGIYQLAQANSTIDSAVNSNFSIRYIEKAMKNIYNEEQIAEYNKQKEEKINQIKKEVHKYLIIDEIGLTLVYIAVLPLEKKEILKYVTKKDEM